MPHGVEHVLGIFHRQIAILQQRRVDRFGQHAQQVDGLSGHHRSHIEQRILHLAFENIACHVFGRRHIFERRMRENLPDQLGMGNLPEKAVLAVGIDFKRMAQADLFVFQA